MRIGNFCKNSSIKKQPTTGPDDEYRDAGHKHLHATQQMLLWKLSAGIILFLLYANQYNRS